MKNLEYLIDSILYQIFKIILNIHKKYEEKTINPSIRIYINKIENRITFKIKIRYYLELLTPENVPYLEITELVLIYWNFLNNSYQQNSRVLYIFVPNKWFGQLLDISPNNFIFLKKFDSEFLHIEVWFTDQNSNPLEIEDKINNTLVIN